MASLLRWRSKVNKDYDQDYDRLTSSITFGFCLIVFDRVCSISSLVTESHSHTHYRQPATMAETVPETEVQLFRNQTWCTTQTKTFSFSFTWTIRNYSCHVKDYGEAVTSPPFSSADEPDKTTKWYLAIYPKGVSQNYADYFSFQLIPILDKDEIVKAKYLFCILKEKDEKTNTTVNKCDTWFRFSRNVPMVECNHVIQSTTLRDTLVDDTLKIYCEITVMDETTTAVGSQINLHTPCQQLPKDFGHLLKNQLFSDVTLIANDEKFKVHKCILAARSTVFAAMFTHEMKESNTNVVKISDVDNDVLREVLSYIYTEEAPNLENMASSILIAADKYALECLKIKCANILGSTLSIENAAEILALADMYRSAELKTKTLDFVRRNCTDVLTTPSWNTLIHTYRPLLLNDVMLALSKFVLRD